MEKETSTWLISHLWIKQQARLKPSQTQVGGDVQETHKPCIAHSGKRYNTTTCDKEYCMSITVVMNSVCAEIFEHITLSLRVDSRVEDNLRNIKQLKQIHYHKNCEIIFQKGLYSFCYSTWVSEKVWPKYFDVMILTIQYFTMTYVLYNLFRDILLCGILLGTTSWQLHSVAF